MKKIRNYTQHNLPLKTKTNNTNVQGGAARPSHPPDGLSFICHNTFAIITLVIILLP